MMSESTAVLRRLAPACEPGCMQDRTDGATQAWQADQQSCRAEADKLAIALAKEKDAQTACCRVMQTGVAAAD